MHCSAIQTNNSIRWCPTADCPYAMKKKRTVERPCVCKCGYEFCFECNEYWHEPVTCTRLKQWKNNRDAETYSWIAEHAKVCPKCEAVIEKNGGCNHMVILNNFFHYSRSQFTYFVLIWLVWFVRRVVIVVMSSAGFAWVIGVNIMLAIDSMRANPWSVWLK